MVQFYLKFVEYAGLLQQLYLSKLKKLNLNQVQYQLLRNKVLQSITTCNQVVRAQLLPDANSRLNIHTFSSSQLKSFTHLSSKLKVTSETEFNNYKFSAGNEEDVNHKANLLDIKYHMRDVVKLIPYSHKTLIMSAYVLFLKLFAY